jgi:hypothetical protein
VRQDACTDPACNSAKVSAHVQETSHHKQKLEELLCGCR